MRTRSGTDTELGYQWIETKVTVKGRDGENHTLALRHYDPQFEAQATPLLDRYANRSPSRFLALHKRGALADSFGTRGAAAYAIWMESLGKTGSVHVEQMAKLRQANRMDPLRGDWRCRDAVAEVSKAAQDAKNDLGEAGAKLAAMRSKLDKMRKAQSSAGGSLVKVWGKWVLGTNNEEDAVRHLGTAAELASLERTLTMQAERLEQLQVEVAQSSSYAASLALEEDLRERGALRQRVRHSVATTLPSQGNFVAHSVEEFMNLELLSTEAAQAFGRISDAMLSGECFLSLDSQGNATYHATNPETLLDALSLWLIPQNRNMNSELNTRSYREKVARGEIFIPKVDGSGHMDEDLAARSSAAARYNITLAVFGPRESGRSTLLNTVNHFASTLPSFVDDMLSADDLAPMPLESWHEISGADKEQSSWPSRLFGNPSDLAAARPGALRAQHRCLIPDWDDPVPCYNVLQRPVRTLADDRLTLVNSTGQAGGATAYGSVTDSWNTQLPEIEPLMRVRAIDMCGWKKKFSVHDKSNTVMDEALRTAQVAGITQLDALVLVINPILLTAMDQSGDHYRQGMREHVELLQSVRIEQQSKQGSALPVHVVFTRAESLSPREQQQAMAQLHDLFDDALGGCHLYWVEHGRLFGDCCTLVAPLLNCGL